MHGQTTTARVILTVVQTSLILIQKKKITVMMTICRPLSLSVLVFHKKYQMILIKENNVTIKLTKL